MSSSTQLCRKGLLSFVLSTGAVSNSESHSSVSQRSSSLSASSAQDRSQWQELEDMLKEHRPDAVCLQEVRMAAHCESGAKPGDGRPRDRSRPNTSTAAYKKDAELVGRLMAQGKELRGYKVQSGPSGCDSAVSASTSFAHHHH